MKFTRYSSAPVWAKVPFQSSIFSKTLLAPAGGRHRLLIHSCRSTLEAVSRFSGFASWLRPGQEMLGQLEN